MINEPKARRESLRRRAEKVRETLGIDQLKAGGESTRKNEKCRDSISLRGRCVPIDTK